MAVTSVDAEIAVALAHIQDIRSESEHFEQSELTAAPSVYLTYYLI